jgi:hypothetical protein
LYRVLWDFGEANKNSRVAKINLRLPAEMKQRTLFHEILHVLHPEWNESQIIAMTDHYMTMHQKRIAALPQSVAQMAGAESTARPNASPADIVSMIPHLMTELNIKPKEATSITGLLRNSQQQILGAA